MVGWSLAHIGLSKQQKEYQPEKPTSKTPTQKERLNYSRDVAVGAVGGEAEPERQPARPPGQVDGEV